MPRVILIADDEAPIRRSLAGVLGDEGYEVIEARDGAEALASVAEEQPDLVLLDIWMPGDTDGIGVLGRLRERFPGTPVIMISGHGNIETAVKAIKMGAHDFIEKPLSLDKVVVAVNNALNLQRLAEENVMLRQKVQERARPITGRGEAVCRLRSQIELVAPTNAWVLITGENGTGKELVARQIHARSQRAALPMVEVNCAAIPEELIESELFGHEKGAFTGATERRRGKFDLANEGTLFLDEIGDMSLKTQSKILRILQEQRFERVGGSRTITVNVRVIAATNKDLEQEITRGNFRQDLYWRLNVVPLRVPPLRERIQDIDLLLEDFLREFATEGRGGTPKRLSPEALAALRTHEWPGNVRELKNLVERLVILTPHEVVGLEDLPQRIRAAVPGTPPPPAGGGMREARVRFEREFILSKLAEHGGNISQTAEAIGLERSHLHKKMKALGIEPDKP
ncbi:MAG: sigma-54 dependent transcriptional regulator [Pseudomonadota bacterium]